MTTTPKVTGAGFGRAPFLCPPRSRTMMSSDDGTQELYTSSSVSADEDSISLNGLDDADAEDPTEREGVALLRQIFPDETPEELRLLHRRRLSSTNGGGRRSLSASSPSSSSHPAMPSPTAGALGGGRGAETTDNDDAGASALRRRILLERFGGHLALNSPLQQQLGRHSRSYILPHDFLRLPPSIAVRRYDDDERDNKKRAGRWRYQLVRDLAERAVAQHEYHCEAREGRHRGDDQCAYYARAVFRDATGGLGISLCEKDGRVLLYSVDPGRHSHPAASLKSPGTDPLFIAPGDQLIGINGTAFLETRNPEQKSLVRHAVSVIKESPDPVVLHLARATTATSSAVPHPAAPPSSSWSSPNRFPASHAGFSSSSPARTTVSDTTDSAPFYEVAINEHHDPVYHSTPPTDDTMGTPLIHPFAAALRVRGLLVSYEQERETTLQLADMTDRVRQWEGAPQSPYLLDGEADDDHHLWHPLEGVRKALSVRILNSFVDGSQSAYCIWVHDAEAGAEFFSPVRYLRDFADLRAATVQLCPSVSNWTFPREPFTLFGSPVRQETPKEREAKCRTLENFVRSLCGLLYRGPDDVSLPELAEIAVHVQSFLGYGSMVEGGDEDGSAWMSPSSEQGFILGSSHDKAALRSALKRSFQLYTYRLFLLDGAAGAVRSFVDAMRDRSPNLDDLEGLEAQGRSVLKDRAMKDLQSIQAFLDWMQDMILEACRADFTSIASRDEYAELFRLRPSGVAASVKDAAWLEPFMREAVREQVEIEVYVPLRGVASRWLVRGWRHEDMEVQFKIKELRRRRQHPLLYGRAPNTSAMMDDDDRWSARASKILSDRVGGSTLPCVKLKAIVDAAREISNHFAAASAAVRQSPGEDATQNNAGSPSDPWLLGADDFLPLFMHCVVQADIERPCALCVLLKTLCDPMNRMGEIGYYLASFEATIAHIQEFDLSTATEHDSGSHAVEHDDSELTSFLSVPLNASP